jgi:hypothetical protein
MKNLLSEELERYQTLSNYNTKFTLTENTEIISENIIVNEQLGVSLKSAQKAFKTIGKDLASFTKIQGKQLETLLTMSDDTFAKELTSAMNKDLKNTKANQANGFKMLASKELSKIQAIRDITRKQSALLAKFPNVVPPKTLTVKQIDNIIAKVKNANDVKYSSLKSGKNPGGVKTAPGPGGNRNRDKAGGVAAANPGLVARIKAGMTWPNLLKVGAGIATVGVLWWLFKDNSPIPPPVPNPDPEPTPNPEPNPNPNPTPSKYKTCPDTFPIAMYCKNETVRKVQGCLSIKTDGAFGTGTQSALVAKGLPGTEITQNTVDVACGSKVVEPVVDPNVDLIDGEDATKL